MRQSILAIAFVAIVALVSFPAQAQDKKPVQLFNGKDLAGWVSTCEAEVTKDGELFIKGGNGLVKTEKQYTNFVLECDWKALDTKMWDSGIYFRFTEVPPKRPWPTMYQVNLRKGLEGNIGELKEAKSEGLTKPNEWNHFKLTVKGTAVELEINGKPAWKADGLKNPKGFIAIQAEVPGGGQFLFKNITLVELD